MGGSKGRLFAFCAVAQIALALGFCVPPAGTTVVDINCGTTEGGAALLGFTPDADGYYIFKFENNLNQPVWLAVNTLDEAVGVRTRSRPRANLSVRRPQRTRAPSAVR